MLRRSICVTCSGWLLFCLSSSRWLASLGFCCLWTWDFLAHQQIPRRLEWSGSALDLVASWMNVCVCVWDQHLTGTHCLRLHEKNICKFHSGCFLQSMPHRSFSPFLFFLKVWYICDVIIMLVTFRCSISAITVNKDKDYDYFILSHM